jgi:hypothetical protein
MAIADVTPIYVNTITYGKYESRTSNSSEFDSLKDIYSLYLNSDTCFLPDKKYTHGLALLLAHHYALDDTQAPDSGGGSSSVGSISSESVGDVSVSYGNTPAIGDVPGWKSWLMQTKWGSQFVYMMNTFKPSPMVTGRATGVYV